MKRFERFNVLDTALYKNYLFLTDILTHASASYTCMIVSPMDFVK